MNYFIPSARIRLIPNATRARPATIAAAKAPNPHMLLLHAVVTGLVTGPSRGTTSSPATGQSRRQLLSSGALAFFSLPRPCTADGFGDFAQQQQTEARSAQAARAAAERQKLQDPFAAARAEGREGVYADELPPLSAAERTERAERVKRLAAETRPAPKVDTVQTGLPVGRSNVERGLAAPDARPAVPTDEYSLEFDCGQPLGLTLRDLRVALETQSGQVLGPGLELGPLVALGLGRAEAGAWAGAAYPILRSNPPLARSRSAHPAHPAHPRPRPPRQVKGRLRTAHGRMQQQLDDVRGAALLALRRRALRSLVGLRCGLANPNP